MREGPTWESRVWKAHKRIKNWLAEYTECLDKISAISFPADAATQHELSEVFPLERIVIRKDQVFHLGEICPWCGAMAGRGIWTEEWKKTCPWCLVKSSTTPGLTTPDFVIPGETIITQADPDGR